MHEEGSRDDTIRDLTANEAVGSSQLRAVEEAIAHPHYCYESAFV